MQKESEFAALGGDPDRPPEEMFRAEEGSDQTGRVLVNLHLQDDAYMRVYERVTVRGTAVHRLAYSYALIIGGDFVLGWERDPSHKDSPVHEHYGKERKRKRGTKPTSLKRALELAWEELSQRAEASLGDAP